MCMPMSYALSGHLYLYVTSEKNLSRVINITFTKLTWEVEGKKVKKKILSKENLKHN